MLLINQTEEIEINNRAIRANNLVKETKILTIARLAKMLVDLYGSDEPFKKIGNRGGQEIEIYFKELDEYITFILTTDRSNFDCYTKKAKNPISKITITVREDKILQLFSEIVRSKSNVFGLIKLLKYIILRKMKIKGSYFSTLKWVKTVMIGKHIIYKNK
ncbi:MAG: hypothetical protein ACFFB8_09410 [Promethearchaeota archaeon]